MGQEWQVSERLISELRQVQADYERHLASLPAELRAHVVTPYAADDFKSPGRLSILALPYWLADHFGLAWERCRALALGNLYGIVAFLSLDGLMDDDRPGTDDRAWVAVGTLFNLQIVRHYQALFPSDSRFWALVERYWAEWAEAALWEPEQGPTRRPFDQGALRRAARKAAPLKICPSGIALLAGRAELIPALEEAVDMMHVTMQLLDDLHDWREDLRHRRHNAFLGTLVAEGLIPDRLGVFEDEVSEALVRTDIVNRYIDTISGWGKRTQDHIAGLGIGEWAALIGALLEDVNTQRLRFEQHLAELLTRHLVTGLAAREGR
jgi:hypothetical protein